MNNNFHTQTSFFRLKRDTVRELIHRQELKRYWVAESTGVHKTTLRRWLSGRIHKVSAENIARLATVLTSHPLSIAEPIK